MEHILTMDEIRRRYDGEWVLIADPEVNDYQEVLHGRVVYHHADRDVFDREVLKLPPRKMVAVEFMGDPDPKMEYIL